ncbi:MAG: hypothetical protein RLZZ127_3351 [Planctomycetota bacterium]|jgi:hypothetical protein
MIRVGVDTSRAEAKLAAARRQIPFATAQALTATARDAKQDVEDRIPVAFDRPEPFTARAIAIVAARKNRLVARVLVKDRQAAYLAIQERGGTREPVKGKPVSVPVQQRTNRYGNIGKGIIGRLVKQADVFVVAGDTPRTAHLAPGIYRRAKRGTRRDGGKGTTGALRHGPAGKTGGGQKGMTSLKLLVALEGQATYKPTFRFDETVRKTVQQRFEMNFRFALRRAMRTAR